MKVLHVIDSLDVGGAEMLLTGLCALWKRSAFRVEVYVLRGGGLLEEALRHAGVSVHVAGAGSVYSPVHILRLARFLRPRRFDLIHVHLYPAQLWTCLAVRLANCATPVVTTEHSTSNRRRTGLLRWFDRLMYRDFAAIAAISEATRESLLTHVGVHAPPVLVVRNGVDPSRFEFSLRRLRPPKTNSPVILSTGSLTRVKDQATIIRAVAQTDDARLILAGDGPLRGELEALASQLGVRERIDFCGVRNDIPQLMADADLYVQASIWEGFCLAVVEAMCGGLPCIAARNSGLQEIVGDAGLYFEPGHAGELASKIRILAGDPQRRAELASRGLEQSGKFTLADCRSAYEKFYGDALDSATRAE